MNANHSSHPEGTIEASRYPLRYLPNSPVRYPASCNHVASVEESSNACMPPTGPRFFQTPLVCEYVPVKKLARLGQHDGLGTNADLKRTPRRISPLRR